MDAQQDEGEAILEDRQYEDDNPAQYEINDEELQFQHNVNIGQMIETVAESEQNAQFSTIVKNMEEINKLATGVQKEQLQSTKKRPLGSLNYNYRF